MTEIEPYDRRLTKETLTKDGLVKATECIKYIQSCGYTLQQRRRGYYHFRNPSRPPEHRDMVFTLSGLRDAYLNGW